MPGPVPNRSDQRRRTNKPEVEIATAPARATVDIPEPDEAWHPIAASWFESLGQSGQSVFMEPSDWAQARYLAELMHRSLDGDRTNGQLISSILSGAAELLTTEGARRRMRIELAKADTGPTAEELAATADMDAYRKRLGS